MCERVFDFTSGDTDNSWLVTNDKAPFKVVRNSDGKEFIVGDDHSNIVKHVRKSEESKNCLPIEVEQDMKRFNSIVSVTELDASNQKRSVFLHLPCNCVISMRFGICYFSLIYH